MTRPPAKNVGLIISVFLQGSEHHGALLQHFAGTGARTQGASRVAESESCRFPFLVVAGGLARQVDLRSILQRDESLFRGPVPGRNHSAYKTFVFVPFRILLRHSGREYLGAEVGRPGLHLYTQPQKSTRTRHPPWEAWRWFAEAGKDLLIKHELLPFLFFSFPLSPSRLLCTN